MSELGLGAAIKRLQEQTRKDYQEKVLKKEAGFPVPEEIQVVLNHPLYKLALLAGLMLLSMKSKYLYPVIKDEYGRIVKNQMKQYLEDQKRFLLDCQRDIFPEDWSKNPSWTPYKESGDSYACMFLDLVRPDVVMEEELQVIDEKGLDINNPEVKRQFLMDYSINTDPRLKQLAIEAKINEYNIDHAIIKY